MGDKGQLRMNCNEGLHIRWKLKVPHQTVINQVQYISKYIMYNVHALYCNTRMFYNTTLYILCNVSEFPRLDTYVHVRVLFILYLFGCTLHVGSGFPFFLFFLYDHLSYVVCYAHVYMYMTYRDRWGNSVQVGGLGTSHHS